MNGAPAEPSEEYPEFRQWAAIQIDGNDQFTRCFLVQFNSQPQSTKLFRRSVYKVRRVKMKTSRSIKKCIDITVATGMLAVHAPCEFKMPGRVLEERKEPQESPELVVWGCPSPVEGSYELKIVV